MRHDRQRFYIPPTLQERIRHTRVLFAGLGLASTAAECCLRLGFEHLVLVDGDTVAPSNLNRQNFTAGDVGAPKVHAARRRLLAVHPGAQIEAHPVFLDEAKMRPLFGSCDIVVNTIDFEDGQFLTCNRVARACNKPVLFPMNLGWAGLVYLFRPDQGPVLEQALEGRPGQSPQLALVSDLLASLAAQGRRPQWMQPAFQRYRQDPPAHDPQLAIASLLTGAMVSSLLVQLVQGQDIAPYPHPHWTNTQP